MTTIACMHSCGGWYAAVEDAEGFHGAPPPGWGHRRCHDTPEEALAAHADREAQENMRSASV